MKKLLVDAGFSRFSIGIQDFDDEVSKTVNRRPSQESATAEQPQRCPHGGREDIMKVLAPDGPSASSVYIVQIFFQHRHSLVVISISTRRLVFADVNALYSVVLPPHIAQQEVGISSAVALCAALTNEVVGEQFRQDSLVPACRAWHWWTGSHRSIASRQPPCVRCRDCRRDCRARRCRTENRMRTGGSLSVRSCR